MSPLRYYYQAFQPIYLLAAVFNPYSIGYAPKIKKKNKSPKTPLIKDF
jgi:hypothetical protein